MATPLQNRLVGLMVLTALAALFLPDLLNGEKARVEEQFATIPLRPNAVTPSIDEAAFAPIDAQPAPALPEPEEDQPADDQSGTKTAESGRAAQPAEVSETGGWTLRVGSFRNAGNVKRLITELRGQGYPAYSFPSQPVDGELTVVYIGPEVDREALAAMQLKLERQRALQSRLERYDPLKI